MEQFSTEFRELKTTTYQKKRKYPYELMRTTSENNHIV